MTIPDSTIAKIASCPFCGRDPEAYPSGESGKGLMIECTTAGCVNPHVSYYDHRAALTAWNRRNPQTRIPTS